MELKSSFKLSLIFLLVAAPTSIVLAQASITPCSFNGFTVGLGLGATTFMSNMRSNASVSSDLFPEEIIEDTELFAAPPTLTGNVFTNNASADVYKYSAIGSAFVGYGYVFDNHTYLGAELGLNLFGATNTTLNNSSSSNVTMEGLDVDVIGTATYNNSLTSNTRVTRNSLEPFLDLKAGFLVTPTALVYLRGGINYNTLKIKTAGAFQASAVQSTSEGATSSAMPPTSGFSFSHSKSQIGWRAGIGTEVMVTPEFGIGADYIYTFYPKISSSVGNSAASDVSCDVLEGCQTVDATIASSSRATLSDQQVMAQLIYHFG